MLHLKPLSHRHKKNELAIDRKSENVLILLTLILWFHYCIPNPLASAPPKNGTFPPSPSPDDDKLFFYYYYDVVNGTTTKAELRHIVRHTKTYLHRDAGTTLGCKSLHFSLFNCAAIRKLQINKTKRLSSAERRFKQFQLNLC